MKRAMVTRVTKTEFELVSKLPGVPRKVTPAESDIRPTAVSLAASLKQEPSTESHGRFW